MYHCPVCLLDFQEELKVSERGLTSIKDADDKDGGPHFQTTFGLVLSCMGCVVGTGNIWRFPRIVANNSSEEGGQIFEFTVVAVVCIVGYNADVNVTYGGDDDDAVVDDDDGDGDDSDDDDAGGAG